jgi:hypothetical protein
MLGEGESEPPQDSKNNAGKMTRGLIDKNLLRAA